MGTDLLDRLALLVGKEALQKAEANAAENSPPLPGKAVRSPWLPRKEELEESDNDEPDKRVNPRFVETSSVIDTETVTIGEITSPNVEFCPVVALSRIHLKYKDKRPEGYKDASDLFFSSGKFWKRCWSLYYISSPFTQNPVVFVKARDAWDFLAEINKRLDLDWGFGKTPNKDGFLLSFPDNGLPRPRFLGISTKKAEFEDLRKKIPAEDQGKAEALSKAANAGDEATTAFREKVRKAFALSVEQTRPSKKQKEQRRQEKKESWCKQLRRAQRYLGIREAVKAERVGALDNITSFEEEEQMLESLDKASRSVTPELDPTISAPYPFDLDVVFICIDIEAFEGTRNVMTEIGISSLDTRDLAGIMPDIRGRNWFNRVRARHFRIREHSGYVNGQYVQGCPDRFEKSFGESEWVALADVAKAMSSCFNPPFCAQRGAGLPGPEVEKSPRNIILVGHDVASDVDFLRRAGYDIKNLPNVVEILDTVHLFQALKHESQAASLATVLQDVGVDAWNLHNAGNDAAYTLQGMVGIVLKGLAPKKVRSPQTKEERMDIAREAAAKLVAADWDEWAVASDKGEDGGDPDPFVA